MSATIVCTDGHLEKLAENLSKKDNWSTLSVKLGVTSEELEKAYKGKNVSLPKGSHTFCLSFL